MSATSRGADAPEPNRVGSSSRLVLSPALADQVGALEPVEARARHALELLLKDETTEPLGLVCIGPLSADRIESSWLANGPQLAWLEADLLFVVWALVTPAALGRSTRLVQRALPSKTTAGLVVAEARTDTAAAAIDFARSAQRRAKTRGRDRLAHDPVTALVVADQNTRLPLDKVGALRRLELRVLRCRPNVLQAIVGRRRPVAIIADASPATREVLDRLSREGLLGKARIIWVGDEPPTEAWPRAAHLVPGPRLSARLLDVVGNALGIKQRRHLRADEESHVSMVSVAQATPTNAKLINLSESGAKLQVDGAMADGEKVTLSFQLPTGTIEATARVVRQLDAQAKRQVAVEFDPLPSEMADRIARFVETALPEAGGRRKHHRRDVETLGLKARLKPVGAKATTYLTVIDLSEGGFLAQSAPNVTSSLTVGMVTEVMINARGRSFSCRGGVVRREQVADRFILAVRFLELDRLAYGTLRSFLSMVPAPEP